jgi:alpha-beta hydrolase superfamily lysophospholipase
MMASNGIRFSWFLRWALLAALLFPLDARAQDKEKEIPDPEDIQLKTKDGLHLHATFYPGTAQKLAVPVILLHGIKGDRHEFANLALALQKVGHAVIAPDLRGHGESLEIDRTDGGSDKIEVESLKAGDVEDMVKFDLEAVKKFLVEKNNAGELNIDKLCVVGADMGALVAVDWAALDWSWPVFSSGKQGQDVKALVLISPESNVKGLKMTDAINDPEIRSKVAILLIAGRKGGKSAEEVNKLYRHFTKFHTDKSGPALDRLLVEAKLQGAQLLGETSLGVEPVIIKFVNQQAKKATPWSERRSLLE